MLNLGSGAHESDSWLSHDQVVTAWTWMDDCLVIGQLSLSSIRVRQIE